MSEDEEKPEPDETPTKGLTSLRPETLARVVTPLAVVAALVIGLFAGGIVGSARVQSEPQVVAEAEVWTCSMHPEIRQPTAGQCPICGMDLVLSDGKPSPRRVVLSEQAAKLAGLRTVAVESSTQRPEIHLLGRITIDENRVRTITPWTAGRIDRLFVRETGSEIKRGQVVAKLYSEEVYTATRDLIQAKKQAAKLAGGLHGSEKLAKSTVESARERLRLLGVPDATVKKFEKSGKPPKLVSVFATASGTVIERHVDQGAYIDAGTPLFHVADLTGVWVQVDAYENDLPHLELAQTVTLTVQSIPGEVFTGEIAFIDPVVDPRTRTIKVRVEVDNPDGQLRPGMFAEALIETGMDEGERLVVPASAVLFTGRRSVVYVEVPDQDEPTYELRRVSLGAKAGSFYSVHGGLAEGERVVAQGAFVLDADLQLRGGDSMMSFPGAEAPAGTAIAVPAEFMTAMKPVVARYLDIHEALAGDDGARAKQDLQGLAELVDKVEPGGSREAQSAWGELSTLLVTHAGAGARAEDIDASRSSFEALSGAVETLLTTFGNPSDVPVAVARCPMAFDGRGAMWVQRGTTIANPYFGSAMHKCGDIEATVRPGENLAQTRDAPKTPHDHAGHDH